MTEKYGEVVIRDVVLTDAEGALEAQGELSGKHIREDLVDTIFSRFCVGK